MTDAELGALESGYADSPHFTDAEKAAIAWTEHLTERTFRRHPEAFAALKAHFSDAQIVEITLVSGFFNMWNRFTDSLEIELEPEEMQSLYGKSVRIDPGDLRAYMNRCWWAQD